MFRLDRLEPENKTAPLENPHEDEVQWEELFIAHMSRAVAEHLRAERLGMPIPCHKARPCPAPLRRIV